MTSSDTETDLIINRLPRSVYDQLSTEGRLYDNQLYFIDDDNFDMFNKRVVNVDSPRDAYDAVNADWLSSNYIDKASIRDYADNTKVYNASMTRYIDGDRDLYAVEYTEWLVTVLAGDVQPSDVAVEWNPSTSAGAMNGWNFVIGGTRIPTGYFVQGVTAIDCDNTYDSKPLKIKAVREKTFVKTGALVTYDDVYSVLSSVTVDTPLTALTTKIVELCQKFRP